jgi:hypothetical protein
MLHGSMTVPDRPKRDGRERPKQSFDFKKRTFDSPSIPGAYLFARNISARESLHVRTVARTEEARALCT